MKKYLIYIGILAIGLLLGWFLFGNSSEEKREDNHENVSENKKMWTCSMHPQIMQPEAGNCPICGMDLIPAETSEIGLNTNEFKLTKNAMALANIQTSVVGKSLNNDATIVLSGKITENEEENKVQTSYFSGRIERLYINSTGEKVNKGQLLATIYSPELFATQQELLTTASLKETQPALYKAVRNKLKLFKISENQINQIEKSGKVIENFPIYATVSGTVSEKMANQGETVKQGQPLFKIANLNSVWANFDVFENQIHQFKKGQEIIVTTNANPNSAIKGKVAFIDPVLNQNTRTLKLRVVLANKNGSLKPGMFVKGNIKNTNLSEKQMLTIPSSAVLWTGKRSVIYLKTNKSEPIFEMQEITLGNRVGDTYEILEGLNASDEIVTNGTFTIDAAAQLQGKKSMMNQTSKKDSINSVQTMKLEFPLNFQKEFQETLKAYLKMKDAFITSKKNNVSDLAIQFSNQLKDINTGNLRKMEAFHFNTIISTLKNISESNAIEDQRNHFVKLNENLVTIVINLEKVAPILYVQKCPMANNNKGAIWLSDNKEIKNPYYGDAMLTCGEVKQIIE